MTRSDIMLHIDLECTGSADDESIIEVGIVLTDQTPQLNVLGEFTSLVDPDYDKWKRMKTATWSHARVVEMHKASGLFADIDNARGDDLPDSHMVEGAIIHWLNEVGGNKMEHIPVAGSGVGHYDRKYIRRDWPRLDRRLTYWTYDVGVLRRTFGLVGAPILEGTKDKTHRALDDVRFHVEELRYYMNYIQSTLPKVAA